MNPTSELFIQHTQLPASARLLLCGVDDVQLLEWLMEQADILHLYHRDWGIIQTLRHRFATVESVAIHKQYWPSTSVPFDAALVNIPKGRALARQILLAGLQALAVEGMLYAAGPNKGGAKTAQTDLNQLAPTHTLGTKARHRLVAASRPVEVTPPAHWESPGALQARDWQVGGQTYRVFTQPGIFSYDHLDEGTAFLLDVVLKQPIPPGLRVLDAGCGVGIIGMVAMRELNPARVVWADVDLLAVQAVRRAVPEGLVVPVDLTTDMLEDFAPFNLILCNPPFHRDHKTDTGFMRSFAHTAAEMLVQGGQLMLVCNSFLKYAPILQSSFSSVHQVANNRRYKVLLAQK